MAQIQVAGGIDMVLSSVRQNESMKYSKSYNILFLPSRKAYNRNTKEKHCAV